MLSLWFWGVFLKSTFYIFTYQKRLQNFREYLCIPLSGVCEIDFIYQHPYNTLKCTTFDPYWMKNNVFFDINFGTHIKLKMIKILSTIYFSLAVLFLSVQSYCHHESWVHKTQKFVHDTEKTESASNICFSKTIGTLRMIFNCIHLYTSAL